MQDPSLIPIRAGGAADAAELAAFAARTFADAFGADNRPDHLRTYLTTAFGIPQQTRELSNPAMVTLLAHRVGALIAFAQIQRKDPPPCVSVSGSIELHRFYVDRSAHGTGLAQRLMHEVERAARSRFDAGHLWLGVWERNPRAITFYAKMGFVDCGSTTFYVGPDRQTDRVMVATLFPTARPPV